MSHDDYDMIFKIVLIGDSGVGKTNLLSRYLKNEFSFDTKTTVGVEFGIKKCEFDGVKVKVQLWDTAGQERYKSIASSYYKGAKGALLIYDITRKVTFESVNRWVTELQQIGDKDAIITLIGNKSDIDNHRQVSIDEGNEKAKLYSINNPNLNFLIDLAFLETSACKSTNVSLAFDKMIEGIFFAI